jgi:molybdate transport system ATP-binding protein
MEGAQATVRTVGESLIELQIERDGFSLDVTIGWEDRVLVLFGPSGSGKSTILECVLGLRPQARGRIRLAGEWLHDDRAGLRRPIEARRLGWVPQSPTLFPHLNVGGNLRLGLTRSDGDGVGALDRAIEVLEIGHLLGRRIDALSGGEQSRVALARALASSPRALLLDEPLAALDLALRARILPYLLRVRDELGLPMLYITHDPDEALLLGGVVAVLDRGRLVASGPAREVLWSTAVLPLSEALGLENVLDARAMAVEGDPGEQRVETASGLRLVVPWHLEPGSAVSLGLPAHEILLAVEDPGRISARNVIPAQIVRCEQRDDHILAHVDAGDPLVAKLTPGAVERLGLAPGKPVYVIIKAHALRRLG